MKKDIYFIMDNKLCGEYLMNMGVTPMHGTNYTTEDLKLLEQREIMVVLNKEDNHLIEVCEFRYAIVDNATGQRLAESHSQNRIVNEFKCMDSRLYSIVTIGKFTQFKIHMASFELDETGKNLIISGESFVSLEETFEDSTTHKVTKVNVLSEQFLDRNSVTIPLVLKGITTGTALLDELGKLVKIY